VHRLRGLLQERNIQAVGVEGLRLIERAEKACTKTQDCIGEFKFATNQDMLQHILQNNMSAMSR
jgi:ferredoxin/flavodoxin---NADP+ reductase